MESGRRGRARRDVESDDEIERVLSTDDESDDDHSSVDSDSETESDSDDVRQNRRSEVVTPSTTQSPPPPELDGRNGLAEGDAVQTRSCAVRDILRLGRDGHR